MNFKSIFQRKNQVNENSFLALALLLLLSTACARPPVETPTAHPEPDQSSQLVSLQDLQSHGCDFVEKPSFSLQCQPTTDMHADYMQIASIANYSGELGQILGNSHLNANTRLGLIEKGLEAMNHLVDRQHSDLTQTTLMASEITTPSQMKGRMYKGLRKLAALSKVTFSFSAENWTVPESEFADLRLQSYPNSDFPASRKELETLQSHLQAFKASAVLTESESFEIQKMQMLLEKMQTLIAENRDH